jgi:hypothetical protein
MKADNRKDLAYLTRSNSKQTDARFAADTSTGNASIARVGNTAMSLRDLIARHAEHGAIDRPFRIADIARRAPPTSPHRPGKLRTRKDRQKEASRLNEKVRHDEYQESKRLASAIRALPLEYPDAQGALNPRPPTLKSRLILAGLPWLQSALHWGMQTGASNARTPAQGHQSIAAGKTTRYAVDHQKPAVQAQESAALSQTGRGRRSRSLKSESRANRLLQRSSRQVDQTIRTDAESPKTDLPGLWVKMCSVNTGECIRGDMRAPWEQGWVPVCTSPDETPEGVVPLCVTVNSPPADASTRPKRNWIPLRPEAQAMLARELARHLDITHRETS